MKNITIKSFIIFFILFYCSLSLVYVTYGFFKYTVNESEFKNTIYCENTGYCIYNKYDIFGKSTKSIEYNISDITLKKTYHPGKGRRKVGWHSYDVYTNSGEITDLRNKKLLKNLNFYKIYLDMKNNNTIEELNYYEQLNLDSDSLEKVNYIKKFYANSEKKYNNGLKVSAFDTRLILAMVVNFLLISIFFTLSIMSFYWSITFLGFLNDFKSIVKTTGFTIISIALILYVLIYLFGILFTIFFE